MALCCVVGCTSPEGRAPKERLIGGDADFEASYALISSGTVTRVWCSQGERLSMEFVIDSPFYLKRHEVTVREWMELMDDNPSPFTGCGLDCPVVNVSWYDGIDFMNKMSIREGLRPCYEDRPCEELLGPGCEERRRETNPDDPLPRRVRWRLDCDGYRYPSEPEWQLAALGGAATAQGSYTNPPMSPGDHGSPDINTIAVYRGNSGVTYEGGASCSKLTEGQYDYCGPAPVGAKLPNAFGLYDMMGNVHEWTWGERLWDTNQDTPDIIDKRDGGGLTTYFSTCRTFSGCSWSSSEVDCLSDYYSCNTPGIRSTTVGLRPVRAQKL